MKSMYSLLFLSLFSFNALAVEVAGINFEQQISLNESKKILQLNGAGIRYKFFFKIYAAALYVEETAQDPSILLSKDTSRLFVMHILYDHIEREKMVSSIVDSLENNLSKDEFANLKPRITSFVSHSKAVNQGDIIIYDYTPGKGTSFSINDQLLTTVPGVDFNNALMQIWLGDNPPSDSLKSDLLGSN